MLLIINALFYFLTASPMQKLTIEITNIKQPSGTMIVGIYDAKSNFPTEKKPPYFKFVPITKTDDLKVTIELPQGQYAIAIFQDLNENKVLDKNRLGIPKEPYAFSNNFRPKFSAPKFEDCAFEVGATPRTISIKMGN
jgi:uncharacterized protein (DUF2141 family)